MKNFPNQAIDLNRIRQTLEVISGLNANGADTSDDGVLGYALAKAGAYTFRKLDLTGPDALKLLMARITEERKKPSQNQGVRTNAREMRRTLLALGWLDEVTSITEAGTTFLESAPGSQDERVALSLGLLQLEVTDPSGNTSHPVRVMLDLLGQRAALHRAGLELALEARDDSIGERERVRELYKLPQRDREMQLGVSTYQVSNAKKIFPSLARAAGLVFEDEEGRWFLTPDGEAAVTSPNGFLRAVGPRRKAVRPSTHRKVNATTAARGMGGINLKRPLTPEEQNTAATLLAERTERHQQVVRAVASVISRPGGLFEDPLSFDLVFVPEETSLPICLFEIKTLDHDTDRQCRQAFAQLRWYHYFNVSPLWPDRAVREVAVFDAGLPQQLRLYLDSEDISSIQMATNGRLEPLTALGADLPELIGGQPQV